MRIISLSLSDIQYTKKEYEVSLEESIRRRGLAFPLKIKMVDGIYICEDGHKRLSVLEKLALEDPQHRYVTKIPVILVNTDLNRSNDCWRDRNMH